MNVLGRIFLNSRKEGRKDVKTERMSFFVRCRRTYVFNKYLIFMSKPERYTFRVKLRYVFQGSQPITIKGFNFSHLRNHYTHTESLMVL